MMSSFTISRARRNRRDRAPPRCNDRTRPCAGQSGHVDDVDALARVRRYAAPRTRRVSRSWSTIRGPTTAPSTMDRRDPRHLGVLLKRALRHEANDVPSLLRQSVHRSSSASKPIIRRSVRPGWPAPSGMPAAASAPSIRAPSADDHRSVTLRSTSPRRDREAVQAAIEAHDGARIISVSDSIFLAHLGGKIRIEPNIPVQTRPDLRPCIRPAWRASRWRSPRIRPRPFS